MNRPQKIRIAPAVSESAPRRSMYPTYILERPLRRLCSDGGITLNDILAWQKGEHNVRFGGDWEITRGGRTDTGDQPVTMWRTCSHRRT